MNASRMNSLLAWLCAFPHNNEIVKFESLTDGKMLAQTLHQIDSAFFTEDWLAQIVLVGESNTQLKQRNIRKIIKSVVDYNREVLQLSNKQRVGGLNVVEIVDRNNHQELCYLIQSLLSIAVNCEKKGEQVSRIMQLDSAVQKDIMEMLQEGMETQTSGQEQHNHTDSHIGLEIITKERDILYQESVHKDKALKAMEEEKEIIQGEYDRLREQVSSLEERAHRCVELEVQVEQLQEELSGAHSKRVELEATVEEFKTNNEFLENDIIACKEKIMDFSSKQSEIEQMQDKLDEMPQLEMKLVNYEKKIQRLENDTRNVVSLKENLLFLQEKNKKLIQDKLNTEKGMKELEEKRFHSLQQSEQLQIMQTEINEYKTSLLHAEKNLAVSEESASSLQKNLRKMTEERDSLLFTLTSTLEDPNLLSLEMSLQSGDRLDSITEVFTPEMKERLLRLESDNLELKRKVQVSSSDQLEGGEESSEIDRSISPGVSNIEGFEKELLIDKLRSELKSRDKEVIKLKNYLLKLKRKVEDKSDKEGEVVRPRMEHEDRLVMASWYRMGLELHKRASTDLYKPPVSTLPRKGSNQQESKNLKYVSTPTKKTVDIALQTKVDEH